jgi:fatty-acyl-CoA synthase
MNDRFERPDPALHALPASTYALLQSAAERFGDAPALTFIPDASRVRETHSWSFREVLAKVTQTANLFHSIGVGPHDVVAYVLPNLPETHFTLWGAEAAGIALAINPALGAEQIVDLLSAGEARVLVTMAPEGPSDILGALTSHLSKCPSLTHVFVIGEAGITEMAGVTVAEFRAAIEGQPGDALASARRIEPPARRRSRAGRIETKSATPR